MSTQQQQNIDVYRQLVGIRTISWTETALLINNKEIYLRGFGRHEDSDVSILIYYLQISYRYYHDRLSMITYCPSW